MSSLPSKDILAKDVIGYAQELVSEEEPKKLIRNLGIMFYNQAVLEIYSFVNIIHPGIYKKIFVLSESNGNLTEKSTYIYEGELGGNDTSRFDRIISVEGEIDGENVDTVEITDDEFAVYQKYGAADFPYEDSVVYRVRENAIDFCIGRNINVGTVEFNVMVARTPTLLNETNYKDQYIDVPDRYYPLLVNRIASYAEVAHGIKDGTLAVVKLLYEQMLVGLSEEAKAKLEVKLKTIIGK